MKAKAVGRNERTISGRNACKAVKTKIKGVYSYDSNILFGQLLILAMTIHS